MISNELKVLGNDILFEFLESIEQGSFKNATDWGFTIKDKVADLHIPRWGKALAVGPKVTDVALGDYILIENLQWTSKLTYGTFNPFWKTKETKVLMLSKERPAHLAQ